MIDRIKSCIVLIITLFFTATIAQAQQVELNGGIIIHTPRCGFSEKPKVNINNKFQAVIGQSNSNANVVIKIENLTLKKNRFKIKLNPNDIITITNGVYSSKELVISTLTNNSNKISYDFDVYPIDDEPSSSAIINSQKEEKKELMLGIENYEEYLPLIKDHRVAVVTNQTGIFPETNIHLVDYLLSKGVAVTAIFAPEHGFRGTADAGETIKDGKDIKTGLPIVSLYGNNKKPTSEQLKEVDFIIFDIQDIGVRFYTYISTLNYIMEAAAENNKKVIVLDRPNPNAHYVDGYVLNPNFKSFVGMNPVPIVYGMTIGEYAKMINGEKWLKNGIQCSLKVVPLKNYDRNIVYNLPVKPSPNLPNAQSINLYPSTCFFEGANVSEGRGTDFPFQIYGSPFLKNQSYQFIPTPNFGAKEPRFKGQICHGKDLRNEPQQNEINLNYIIDAFLNYNSSEPFWIKNSGELWIDKLAGTDQLRIHINRLKTDKKLTKEQVISEIKKSWQTELEKFKTIRQKYLIY